MEGYHARMRLYKHKSYEEYKKKQVLANRKKFEHMWVRKREVKKISQHIKNHMPNCTFGICHGARNGGEVNYFKKYIDAEIIGTDISPTAKVIPNMVVWDFHDTNPEWIKKCDFVYSNSLDHAYDPHKCIKTWMECLKNNGICYVHWDKEDERHFSSADCFAASKDYYRVLFNEYKIIDELDMNFKDRMVFAVKNK